MKSGYWRTDYIVRERPNRVFYCDEHFVTYRYDGNGKWSRLDHMPGFGWSDDYEYMDEEEALELMKVFDSEDFAPDADAAEYISRSIGKFLHQREIDAEYSRNPTLKLHEAIRFAEEMHRGQKRKGTDIDYIIHPMEVLRFSWEKAAPSKRQSPESFTTCWRILPQRLKKSRPASADMCASWWRLIRRRSRITG